MKATGFGTALGIGLLVAAVVWGGPQAGAGRQPQDRAVPGDQLIAMSFDLGDGRQQVTMVDPRQHVLAVYHIDKATGAIALKSVRNVQWDMLMEDFNSAGAPTPREVRAISQPR